LPWKAAAAAPSASNLLLWSDHGGVMFWSDHGGVMFWSFVIINSFKAT